jgi:hypothetical protein
MQIGGHGSEGSCHHRLLNTQFATAMDHGDDARLCWMPVEERGFSIAL